MLSCTCTGIALTGTSNLNTFVSEADHYYAFLNTWKHRLSSSETRKHGTSAQLQCWDENCWSINLPSHNHMPGGGTIFLSCWCAVFVLAMWFTQLHHDQWCSPAVIIMVANALPRTTKMIISLIELLCMMQISWGQACIKDDICNGILNQSITVHACIYSLSWNS